MTVDVPEFMEHHRKSDPKTIYAFLERKNTTAICTAKTKPRTTDKKPGTNGKVNIGFLQNCAAGGGADRGVNWDRIEVNLNAKCLT